jgi:hypothetical protein
MTCPPSLGLCRLDAGGFASTTPAKQPTPTYKFLLAACAVLLVACAPELNWRELRPAETNAQLQLPCKPSVFARTLVLAQESVQWSLMSCKSAGQTWAFGHALLTQPAHVEPALAALRAAVAGNMEIQSEQQVAHHVPGSTPNPASGRWRWVGRMADSRVVRAEVLVFSQGLRVFQATVLDDTSSADTRDAMEARDSFAAALRLLP